MSTYKTTWLCIHIFKKNQFNKETVKLLSQEN